MAVNVEDVPSEQVPGSGAPHSAPQRRASGLRVTIDPEGMQATLHVSPDPDRPVTLDDVRAELAAAGVVSGIDALVVDSIPLDQQGSYVVARAVPAEEGDDGYVELLVSPDFDTHHVEEDETGTVDFRAAAVIPEVSAGQALARVVPPSPGVPGVTVLGSEIPAVPGYEAPLPSLENVEVDGEYLKAAVSGLLEASDRRIAVRESLIIEGDVDYETGSITFHGDVVIGGSVKPGFRVVAGGRVLVWGDVDHAEIDSDTAVWVRGAVVGKEALVRSKGDVRARLVYEGRVEARGTVFIEREATEAHVVAGLDVVSEWVRSRIYGGTVRAGRQVIAAELGSRGEEQTTVSVGGDPFRGERLEEVREERAQLYKRLQDVRAQLIPFRARPELTETLDAESQEAVHKLAAEEASIGARLDEIEDELAAQDSGEAEDRPRAVARIALRPGVLLDVVGVRRQIRMTHHAMQAVESEGRVVLEPARLTPSPPKFKAFGTVTRPGTSDLWVE